MNAVPKDKLSPTFAAVALGRFGPDAKLAAPALVGFLDSLNAPKDSFHRQYALDALKAIDPEAAAKAGITNAP
jgi:hypothetical protein